MSGVDIAILIGCIQGVLLSLLLLTGRQYKRKSILFLVLLILSFSIINVFNIIIDTESFKEYPLLLFLPLKWYFTTAFALYYFVQFSIDSRYKLRKWEYALLVPLALEIILQWLIFFWYISDNSFFLKNYDVIIFIDEPIHELLAILFGLISLILALKKISKYQHRLKESYSEVSRKDYQWLKRLLVVLVILWVVWVIPVLYYGVVLGKKSIEGRHFVWVGMAIVIYWIGYAILSKRKVFEVVVLEPMVLNKTTKLSEKIDSYYEILMGKMEKDQLYKDPELSLKNLASEVGISAGYLSQIINHKVNKNFFDFINSYRIEEVKKCLTNSDFNSYSIFGVALEAGFKSKSTFNSIFKKYVGKTPSEFKRSSKVA